MIAATPKHRPLERLEIRRVERPPGLARERVEPNAVHRSNRCSQRSRTFTSPSRTTSTAGRGLPHDWLPRARTLARFAGARPTGKPIRVGGLIFDRVLDGRVAERWEQGDQPAMLRQLGLA